MMNIVNHISGTVRGGSHPRKITPGMFVREFLKENVWLHRNIFIRGLYFNCISIKVYMKVC